MMRQLHEGINIKEITLKFFLFRKQSQAIHRKWGGNLME